MKGIELWKRLEGWYRVWWFVELVWGLGLLLINVIGGFLRVGLREDVLAVKLKKSKCSSSFFKFQTLTKR